MNNYIAPVQGHTDAAWRHYHKEVYEGESKYFTPFIRCEHGDLRKQDMRDITSELNNGLNLEPQVIFRDMKELEILLSRLSAEGVSAVNLNMGCPFPLQTGKGRGAGFLSNKEEISKLKQTLAAHPELSFSVKMRLGFENPEEWRNVLPTLNEIKLNHLDIHPRVAKQQYGGELHLDQFEAILSESRNPVVFNGDIKTPADISEVRDRYPEIDGVMTGRGVLGRPSIVAEYAADQEWIKEERLQKMLKFHQLLLAHYSATLCGEMQLLSKIKPFWEYAEEEIGRKAWKAIKKASNIAKYHSAVALVNN